MIMEPRALRAAVTTRTPAARGKGGTGVLSLHTGYDTAYLTKAVGDGQGADYYTGAAGEPPGYWQGAGAAALGLTGQVDADVMRALYHEDVGPDGQVLVRRQRRANYPVGGGSLYERIEAAVAAKVAERGRFIQPEEVRQIRLQERAKFRTVVPFYDPTFSAPKSVSVLWASLLAASAEAAADGREAEAQRLAEQAEQIREAVKRANDRMIAVAERELAYVRTGRHSKTSGEWRDASGLLVASFPQHTNRDGDPQLHVHNAVANRVQRADGADGKWRALHAYPLFRNKLRLGTLADRFLAQELEELGWRVVLREDGKALEVGGISEEDADTYSDRAKELRDLTREYAGQYVDDHGHAPGKRAMWAIKQRAALETRDAKEHNPPPAGQELAAWARKAERRGARPLSSLHWRAAAYAAEHEPSELPSEAERARIIRKAVAAVQRANSTWDRSQLIFELGQVVPALPADFDPEEYLNGLADEAVSGRAEGVNVLQIAPAPDAIDVTRLGLRKDGTSIYRPPGEERFCTAEHRDHEQYLVDNAILPVPQRISAAAAEAALADTDLDYSQREACLGLLTSARLVNCLMAPAGTGKTHVMAAFARARAGNGAGRVIGLTPSTNAARVMADEAAAADAPMQTYNLAQFLGKLKDSDETRDHVPVYPGDVLVIDEASQVSSEDALRVVQIARRNGAMVIGTFDPQQLGSVDAGGVFRLIAARHGSWKLTEVRRFTHAWEREASLRLREGDVAALAEYDARGRIYHGPQDRVFDEAVTLWLNGYLGGREALLIATSNATAARLAARVRERLIELRQVSPDAEVALADGNQAGRGDLIRARLNTRIDADGQTLANRDVVRLESTQDSAFGRLAVVRRKTGPDEWSRAFFVPLAYLESDAELAYAGNVHVAQGATVDRAHLVVDAGANRSLIYTGATRGREKNTIHVVTGAPDPAQSSRAERDAYADAAIRKAHELRQAGDVNGARAVSLRMPDRPSDRQMAPWEAVLAQALQQDDPERTALEEIQAAQDFTTHTGHLLEIYEAFWRLDVVPRIDEMVRQRVTPDEFARYMTDPERPAFLQVLRAHEIGGRPIPDLLDAITAEPLTGLRSIAAGLHGRAGKEPAPARGATTGWAERAPGEVTPAIEAAGEMLAARQAVLGERLAANPPAWAKAAWGDPRAKTGAERADWERLAGIVESYREAAGITDPQQAIGPVPASKAHLAEAFHAGIRALRLPDEAALLRAMGQGDLEAVVDQHDRAAALAPADVQAEIGTRESDLEQARERAYLAQCARDAEAEAQAEAEAEDAAGDLARLAVADAARREWAEAHADLQDRALDAERELRARGLAERIPAMHAEVAQAAAAWRETPAMDPALWAQLKAEQTARIQADREAEAEKMARLTPVTDAELERYGAELGGGSAIDPADAARWKAEQAARVQADREAEAEKMARLTPATDAEVAAAAAKPGGGPAIDPADAARWKAEQAARVQADREAEAENMTRLTPVTDAELERQAEEALLTPERAAYEADMAEIRAGTERVGELVDQMPDREAERRAQMEQELINEPAAPHVEAEPSLEPAWEPGDANGPSGATTTVEVELEI
jgi:conjugative relaxase-like TrwC/TraI family protein